MVVRAAGRGGADGAARGPGRRWSLGLAAGVVLALLVVLAWALWRVLAGPDAPAATAPTGVPEHQRSGPLANPWGSGPAVVGSDRAPESAASAASAAMAASPASEAAAARRDPAAWLAGVTARDGLRAALAQMRGGARAAEFVQQALKGTDPAALVIAWMVERQCRQATHWRQILDWRRRALAGSVTTARLPAAGPLSEAHCRGMTDAAAVEEGLKAAGFPLPNEPAHTEPTRRPIDVVLALQVGDPLLTAEVLESTSGDIAAHQLQPWAGTDARTLASPEVTRAAVWLASCAPRDAAGRAIAHSSALHEGCRQHPALWQACMHEGMCDLRDLRDLLLRTLTAEELGASERLARTLAAKAAGR